MIPRLRVLLGRLMAGTLIMLLLPVPQLVAQAVAIKSPAGPMMLHINILDGEGALNNISQRTAREPIVQVEDENHKPVAGALVVFTVLHSDSGATATFNTTSNASDSIRVNTDSSGKAIGHGLTPNTIAGQFTISVEASLGALSATAIIHMINSLTGGGGGGEAGGSPATTLPDNPGLPSTSNVARAGSAAGGGKDLVHLFHFIPKWVLIGVAGGAATAAIVVVSTRGSSGATISAGGGTVTAPH